MRILEIGNADSVFFYEYVKRLHIARPDYDIEILQLSDRISRYDYSFLDPAKIHCTADMGCFKKIPFLRGVLLMRQVSRGLTRNGSYDYIHIHYVMPCFSLLAGLLGKKSRLILSFWGTDLLKINWPNARLLRRLVGHAFRITYYTEQMDNTFSKIFNGKYKGITRKIRFGLNALEPIDRVKADKSAEEIKENFGFPGGRFIVCCGGNGYSTQQHAKIIEALGALRHNYKERAYFFFHMGYGGSKGYRAEISRLFAASGLPGRVDCSYMYLEDIARLRLSADIYIIMQKRDGLSAALLEYMYAGSVPIVGRWLKYDAIEGRAVYHTVNSVEGITAELEDIFDHMDEEKEKCRVNREVVENLGSWDESIEKWIRLYEQDETPNMFWNVC